MILHVIRVNSRLRYRLSIESSSFGDSGENSGPLMTMYAAHRNSFFLLVCGFQGGSCSSTVFAGVHCVRNSDHGSDYYSRTWWCSLWFRIYGFMSSPGIIRSGCYRRWHAFCTLAQRVEDPELQSTEQTTLSKQQAGSKGKFATKGSAPSCTHPLLRIVLARTIRQP